MEQPHVDAAGGQQIEAFLKPRQATGGIQVGKRVDQAGREEHIQVRAAGSVVPGVQQRGAHRDPEKRGGSADLSAFPDGITAVRDPGSDHDAGHIGEVIQHVPVLQPGRGPPGKTVVHGPERRDGDKSLHQPVRAGPHQPYKCQIAESSQGKEPNVPGKADQQLPMEKAQGDLIRQVPEGNGSGSGEFVQDVFGCQAPFVGQQDFTDPLGGFPQGYLPLAPAVAGDHRKHGDADLELQRRHPAQRGSAG